MAFLGYYSKEELDNAVSDATLEAQLIIAEKKEELEKLKAEKAAAEEEMKKKIAELEQSLSASSVAHEEELEKLQKAHVEEISVVRRECTIQAQQMIEFIDTRKEELEKKSERELLLTAVMALDGYAGRLDRLERNMEFRDVMKRMSEMKQEFTEKLDNTEIELLKKLEAKELFETIGKMQADVSSQIKDNTDDLTGKIKSMNILLTDLMNSLKLPEKLEALSEQIDDLYQKLSDKVDELEKQVAEKIDAYDITGSLDSIQETVNGIDGTVDDLSESTERIMGLVEDLRSGIEKIESIKEKVDEIKTNVDPYGSYSVYSEVNSLLSKLESIESDIRSIGYSVEEAKDAAERAANHY